MKTTKFIIGMLVCCAALAGCAAASKSAGNAASGNQTVYTYKESNVDGINISKTVYEDNRVTVFLEIADQFTDFSNIKCYDKNFNIIECEWDVQVKEGELVIKGDDANKISGIEIMDSEYDFLLKLRYLDSDQFAKLAYYDATEIGLDTDDDIEAYYTKEEMDDIKDREKSIQSKNKEVFDIFEGYYVCEDNPNLYIRISRSDKGMYFSMKTIDWEGEEENISFSFDEASFRDSDEPTVIFTGPFNCSSANGIELRYPVLYPTSDHLLPEINGCTQKVLLLILIYNFVARQNHHGK